MRWKPLNEVIKPRRKRIGGIWHYFKIVLMVGFSVCFLFGGLVVFWAARLEIPDFTNIVERRVAQSTKIYDRTGKILLYSVQVDKKRSVVPVDMISRNMKNAIVAIEDKKFYEHHGVRPESIGRAVLGYLSGEDLRGGSTITQQLVKNALLTNEKKFKRKIKELILSIKIERMMTKDEILGLYLNEIPFGGTLYGVEEASQAFFGHGAALLSVSEAAYLAALPQAPTYFSPYGNHTDKLAERKNLVITRMVELEFLSQAEGDAAKIAVVTFIPPEKRGIKAPHFVFYVLSSLEERYGRDLVEAGGLTVITTLDWELQEKAEAVVAEYAADNETRFGAKNAGVIGLDPKTGEIQVMVGSRDYFETENDGSFNVTLARRQPGSAFKPIVYAAAFNKGYTPETIVFDLATQFAVACSPENIALRPVTDPTICYKPQNYDEKYRGPISLREALAQSINVPAIKVLYLAGLQNALRLAKDMGVTTLTNANQYGLTLVLGGGEVTLLELSSAYGVFAQEGIRVPPVAILKVENKNGQVLEEATREGERVLSENTARLISSILSDNRARTPAFGARSPLYFGGRDVAAKTGTTNDYKDFWVIGYTPDFVLGAWVGNNDNSAMEKKVAGFVVAPMWHAILEEILATLPEESQFTEPAPLDKNVPPVLRGIWLGGKTFFVDKISGKLATEYTPREVQEERVVKGVHSILYWIDKDNPRGTSIPPGEASNDSQFSLWEEPVRAWAASRGVVDDPASVVPVEEDDIHTKENTPILKLLAPIPGTMFSKDSSVTVELSSVVKYSPATAEYYLNGQLIGTSQDLSRFTFSLRAQENLSESNEFEVIVYDAMRNVSRVNTTILVSL